MDLPVGDPGLPGGMRERDIPGGLDPDEVDNQTGETEVAVLWGDIADIVEERSGHKIPDFLSNINMPSDILISYTYSYDYNNNQANNIKVFQVKVYSFNKIITDTSLCDALGYYFNNDIISDIEEAEEGSKIERDPNYNPHEEF